MHFMWPEHWPACVAKLQQWTTRHVGGALGSWPPGKYLCPHHDYKGLNGSCAVALPSRWRERLLDSLQGGTIWFIGDSLTILHFFAMVCRMGADVGHEAAARAQRLIFGAGNMLVRPLCVEVRPIGRSSSGTKATSDELALDHGEFAKLCIVVLKRFPYQAIPSAGAALAVLNTTFRRRDVLVVNLGIHYRLGAATGPWVGGDKNVTKEAEELRAQTVDLLGAYSALPHAIRPSTFVWRETGPSSFATPNGFYQGQVSFARSLPLLLTTPSMPKRALSLSLSPTRMQYTHTHIHTHTHTHTHAHAHTRAHTH